MTSKSFVTVSAMTENPEDWLTISGKLDRARGAYLSAMSNLDLMLDSALLAFFEVPAFRKQQIARGTLLDRCGFAGKVDTLEYILEAVPSMDQGFRLIVSQLRSANSYRGLLAHSPFDLNSATLT